MKRKVRQNPHNFLLSIFCNNESRWLMEISNEQLCSTITRFIRKEVKKRNARVVVVGISGGIDSAVTVSLATKAVGSKRYSD